MADNDFLHTAQIMKAAIPYVDTGSKTTLDFVSKFFEFIGSFHSFRRQNDLAACGFKEQRKTDFEALLSGIRPLCNHREQEIVDRILSIFSARRMMEMYKTYAEAMKSMQEFTETSETSDASKETTGYNDGDEAQSQKGSSSGMFEMLKSMIPPEQMSTFENLSMLFNTMSYDNNDNNEKPEES